jgi:hypothetical protein
LQEIEPICLLAVADGSTDIALIDGDRLGFLVASAGSKMARPHAMTWAAIHQVTLASTAVVVAARDGSPPC